MRNASIAVLREIGVDTGGSNVQFSVNPADGRMIVIEMNPRVAFVGAGLQGHGLPDRQGRRQAGRGLHAGRAANDITGGATPASFEPSIDYVVTKIPRFAFEKFPPPTTA
jgi:carbamoyl-phosphate synthase large subunit